MRWLLPLACLAAVVLLAAARPQAPDPLPAAAYLTALPDGEVARQFIIDCTGCHTFHAGIAYPGGAARGQESWHTAIGSMLARFGAGTGFPVIGPGRDAQATARWLATSLPPREAIHWHWPAELAGRAEVREYTMPAASDLPHDVAIGDGEIIVTGMFTGRLYRLDSESGAIETEATPRPNPRAVEIAPDGSWWVVLGGPRALARRSPAGDWTVYELGYYAHSVALAPDGGVWANGHFTHEPELISRVDPASGVRTDHEVPAHPTFTSTPVPYEIRVGPDGAVWMTELQGNRLVRYTPASDAFDTWAMPTSASGPRRHDVSPDGTVWIPEYGANKLARFDPDTETFEEYTLPLPATAPYIARWDTRRGVVWVGTGMADAVFRFDPVTETWRYYRLPTPDALVRHLAIDPATGDVWLAPGSSPGTTPARVVRLRPSD